VPKGGRGFRELNLRYDKNDSKNDSTMSLEKNFVRDIIVDHLSGLYQFYGETTGVRVARKHLVWYCAGLKNSHPFRTQVVRVDSASEQLRLTREHFGNSAPDEYLHALI
jgi:tRNA-dihydrouridine synthase B